MSEQSLKNDKKQKKNLELQMEIKKNVGIHNNNQAIIQDSLKTLDINNQHLYSINEILRRSGINTKILASIESFDIGIESFNHLKYREWSLSLKFQMLTNESLERKREYEKYSNILQKLKEENSELLPTNFNTVSQTYNQLKEKLENDPKKDTVLEETVKIEENILRIYLELLNISITSMHSLQKIKEYSEVFELPLQNQLKGMNTQLDSLKRGFFYKKEIVGRRTTQVMKRPLQKISEHNEVSPEYDNREILPYFSLTYDEITTVYNKIIGPHKDSEKFVKLIKKQPILFSFITPAMLSNYLHEHSTPKEAYIHIHQLIITGHFEYQQQYQKLMNLTLNIIRTVLYYSNSDISKITTQYNNYNTQEKEYFNKELDVPKRKSLRVPTLIRDKIENRHNHSSREQVLKSYEIVAKTTKNNYQYEESKGKNAFKSAKPLSLNTPQHVLKEILSIDA